MILESLIFVGIKTIVGAVASHGLAAKAAVVLLKAISAIGLSATIQTSLLVGAVVGGIVWTRDRVDNLCNALEALENDKYWDAVSHLARLAINSNIGVECLPDVVQEGLVKAGASIDDAGKVANVVAKMETDIVRKISELR